MRIGLAFVALMMISMIIFMPSSHLAAGSVYGPSSLSPDEDPAISISLDGSQIYANVEPGNDPVSQRGGFVACTFPSSVLPGQKVIVDLSVEASGYVGSITPPTLEFTRTTTTQSIMLEVLLAEGISVDEGVRVSIYGQWRLEPGTKEGDVTPIHTTIFAFPDGHVNATYQEKKRKASRGEDCEFTLRVENLGNALDRYNISIGCDGDCEAIIGEMSLSIQEKGVSYFTLYLIQVRGSPGTKSFTVGITGSHPGRNGHANMIVYLETHMGLSMLFTKAWGPWIVLTSVLLIAIVVSGTVTFLCKKRKRSRTQK